MDKAIILLHSNVEPEQETEDGDKEEEKNGFLNFFLYLMLLLGSWF
jgi:hypothetical protein